METYLRVTFSSEGSAPSEIVERLHSLGFQPTQGNYDFSYDWRREISTEEAMELANQLTETLRGYKVLFEMETV
ncbi:MAG: hypothetical protein M1144_06205 [Candidatus Thermoplasmatota archaeon]|jgi:hypothetical protein|nr:hypothetical protein [Candidatus Thermoplasmatota archaeon]